MSPGAKRILMPNDGAVEQWNIASWESLAPARQCLGNHDLGEQNSAAEAHSQPDLAFRAGVNFIDTVEMYPVPARAPTSGASESIVGAWLRTSPAIRSLSPPGCGAGAQPELDSRRAASPSMPPTCALRWRQACAARYRLRRSLPIALACPQPADVRTVAVRPCSRKTGHPIREQLEALATLVDEGKVRGHRALERASVGIAEFRTARRRARSAPVVSVQNAYSLLNRTYEFGLAEQVTASGSLLVLLLLAFGHLSAKYLADADAKGRINLFRISASAPNRTWVRQRRPTRRLPGRAVFRLRRWRWPSCIDAGSWQHHHRRDQHGPTRREPEAWGLAARTRGAGRDRADPSALSKSRP